MSLLLAISELEAPDITIHVIIACTTAYYESGGCYFFSNELALAENKTKLETSKSWVNMFGIAKLLDNGQ